MHRSENRKFQIVLYVAAVFVFWISLYFYVPTLPIYVELTTQDLMMVGVVVSMYGLWQAVLRFPLGIASDMLGRRKPFMIIGILFSALGAFVMMRAQGAAGLIIGRGITGFSAATWVLLMVGFSGLFPPEQSIRAAAILNVVNSIGRMIATGLNGTLNQIGGYSLPFLLAIGASVLSMLLILPIHDPTRAPRKVDLGALKKLATRADILLPSLLAALFQFVTWAAIFGYIPIIARDFGASEQQISLLTTMNIGVGVLGNLLLAMLIDRVGATRLLYLSVILTSLALVLIAVAQSFWMVAVVVFIMGLAGIGVATLMGSSIRYVEEKDRSTAMGLHQAVYGFGMFFGPYLSGYMAEAFGAQGMFWVIVAVFAVGGAIGVTQMHRANEQMLAQTQISLEPELE
ncbi:MAG: MFS transporter [Anaerolineaceae bacterium]|nr:MFS transporter [Anaerolineaceae bacterium]